jgi:hypothetical protein
MTVHILLNFSKKCIRVIRLNWSRDSVTPLEPASDAWSTCSPFMKSGICRLVCYFELGPFAGVCEPSYEE